MDRFGNWKEILKVFKNNKLKYLQKKKNVLKDPGANIQIYFEEIIF